MEANHPHLTTQKSYYVEISRARHRAELVTDDREALKARLEAATGERVAALEAVEPDQAKVPESGREEVDRETAAGLNSPERAPGTAAERDGATRGVDRGLALK